MRKAKNRGENKTKKFVMLATYAVAVLCLLAGLFLPLFNGKELLALKLWEAIKSLLNRGNNFSLSYPIKLFGIEKISFDFIAVVVLLYALVTALSVLALIPVILSVLKKGKVAKKFYYGIEIAAIIVLSLFFAVTLLYKNICYNMVIAAGGTAVALLVLSGIDKGKTATVKIGLFLLSAIAFLALFDFAYLLSKQAEFAKVFTDKLSSDMVAGSGAKYLTILFATKISDALSAMPDVKNKLLLLLAAITATIVLINLFIDTIKLATKKDKKAGRIFDIARFGLEVVAAAGTLVIALICKYTLGLMLVVILAVAAIGLAISVIRLISGIKKSKKKSSADKSETNVDNQPVAETPVADDSAVQTPVTEYSESDSTEDPLLENVLLDDPLLTDDDNEAVEVAPVESEQSEDNETVPENNVQAEPALPVPDDDGYIDPLLDEQYYSRSEEKHEVTAAQQEFDAEDLEDVVLYKPEQGATYLVPDGNSTPEEPADIEEPAEQPEEEHVEVIEDPVIERELEVELSESAVEEEPELPPESAVEEEPELPPEPTVEEEPDEQPEPAVEEESDEQPEDVRNPFREDIRPYNPYEKHNNPFKNFDEPPYNPYRQQEAPSPVQEQQAPVYEQPVQQVKPVEPVKPVEQPAERPPVKPLQPRSIIQEFKPVPPVSEQPPKEAPIYTLDAIYAGPMDDFIRKLSNDERIEFAKTFIEKTRGNLGAIPDYNIGGNNKRFFSCVFIYLGRIRGMVSDGLLNKMYKELDLL